MLRTATLVVAASMMRLCSRHHAPRPSVAVIGAPSGVGTQGALASMIPEHGGSVAVSGTLATEVVGMPDGRVVAYLRDADRKPVFPTDINVSVMGPGGALVSVPVAYDSVTGGYAGNAMGITPGSYPVYVAVRTQPMMPMVQLVSPPIMISAPPPPPIIANVPIIRRPPPRVYYRPAPRPYYGYGGYGHPGGGFVPHPGIGFHP